MVAPYGICPKEGFLLKIAFFVGDDAELGFGSVAYAAGSGLPSLGVVGAFALPEPGSRSS